MSEGNYKNGRFLIKIIKDKQNGFVKIFREGVDYQYLHKAGQYENDRKVKFWKNYCQTTGKLEQVFYYGESSELLPKIKFTETGGLNVIKFSNEKLYAQLYANGVI